MTKKSKIAKLVLGSVVSLSLMFAAVPVHASTPEIESSVAVMNVEPCAFACPQCRVGYVTTSNIVYGEWKPAGKQSCSHGYVFGYDLNQTRTVTKKDTCTNAKCNYSRTYNVTEKRTLCYGSYNP